MFGKYLKHALVPCRRVLLLLMLAVTLIFAWLYWQTPGLNAMRPQIELYLQQNLALKEVKLGHLSWSWSGYLWVKVEKIDFSSRGGELAFHRGQLSVRMPWLPLLSGRVEPDRVRLSGGELDIALASSDKKTPIALGLLVLNHVTIHGTFGDWHMTVPAVNLTLNGSKRSLKATSSVLNLEGQLADDGLLQTLSVQCVHTQWLPESIRKQLHGSPQASISLTRHGQQHHWRLDISARSKAVAQIAMGSQFDFAFHTFSAELDITSSEQHALKASKIVVKKLAWTLNGNNIVGQGSWAEGRLKLQGVSDHMDMPVIWGWLRGLGDASWRQWLAGNHAGHVNRAAAEIDLAWPNPLQQLPTLDALRDMLYHVNGDVEGVDIGLGRVGESLSHSGGHIELDQDGLQATVSQAELPSNIGSVKGKLDIAWHTLTLHVAGQGEAGMAGLLHWLAPKVEGDWQWNRARGKGLFELRWSIGEKQPQLASADIQPLKPWHVKMFDQQFGVAAGKIHWDNSGLLKLHDMQLVDHDVKGVLSLTASAGAKQTWQLQWLHADLRGDAALLADRYQMPVSHLAGVLRSSLQYDGQWSGSVDLQEAGWDHLLGSSKAVGEPLSWHYQGKLEQVGGEPTVLLSEMNSRGEAITLQGGSMSISKKRLQAQLLGLHTASFDGSVDLLVPFDEAMWQIDVKGQYLNRTALPAALQQSSLSSVKRWNLHANIDRFEWDAATISGLKLRLSSKPGSVGELVATQVHTADVNIMDVGARFTLPGQGRVDLRSLRANAEQQQLFMSAILTPLATGGMGWSGFVRLDGDFGRLMKRSGLSERFLDGDGHLLFSGKGVALREQPWWQGLDGRLRLRVDEGRILEGGTLTSLLAVMNLGQLPALLLGQRDDLTGQGIKYERLQMEALIQNKDIHVRDIVMRSTAFDLAGSGEMDLEKTTVDLYLVAHPLQNLDAILARIPLLRDILGGAARSFMRKIYHVYGPFSDALVETVNPKQAGLASAGLIEGLLSLPSRWFGSNNKPKALSQ
ncbi:MAG: AsmA-like C-terminal domain-containing protein [Mariprofundus sp.]|nr:AsmA-like C-terminal domain-containing protein [Mariprofundus sp.]